MKRTDVTHEGAICLCRSRFMSTQLLARSLFCGEEQSYFDSLCLENRKRSYLFGRYAAKKAVSFLTHEDLKDINISYGVFNNPVINSGGKGQRLEVSISHSDEVCAALAFPSSHPMAVDVERIVSDTAATIEGELTALEMKLLREGFKSTEQAVSLTVAWTIKESLSKVLKTGLTTPFTVYEISNIESKGSYYVSYYKHFSQYKTVSFMLDDYVCSITLPKKTTCKIDITEIARGLNLAR